MTNKQSSLSTLVDAFHVLDKRETVEIERADKCKFAGSRNFPKRPRALTYAPFSSARKYLHPLTIAEFDKQWKLSGGTAAKARKLKEKLRRIEAREAAVLETAGYFKLKAKADEAEAATDRAIGRILASPVKSWADAAAMLRFMGIFEPFAGSRDDVVARAFHSLVASVRRKVKR